MAEQENTARLEEALRRACAVGPEPDMGRLGAILRQLEQTTKRDQRQRPRRWLPWLLLAGTAAAAAAAAGYGWYLSHPPSSVTPAPINDPLPPESSNRDAPNEAPTANDSTSASSAPRRSSVIYTDR